MSEFLTPVQTALYTRLNAEISSATIYDDVPELPEGLPSTNFPYVVIGDDDSITFDTDDTLGSTVFATLHVWSRYQGKKEVKAIMGDLYTALNRQAANLSATGYRFIDCLFDFANVFEEKDGVTRHGVCRYKLVIEKE